MFLSIPTQTFTMHIGIILFIIAAFVAIFGKSNKPKKSVQEPTALITISKAYDILSRHLHSANTYAEILDLRGRIVDFHYREYADEPASCMRKALRDSLLVSLARKEQELKQITDKL